MLIVERNVIVIYIYIYIYILLDEHNQSDYSIITPTTAHI